MLLQAEKSKALKCGTFGASSIQQRYLATGDFEGKLQIWSVVPTGGQCNLTHGHITATRGRLSHIHQVAPLCTLIQYVVLLDPQDSNQTVISTAIFAVHDRESRNFTVSCHFLLKTAPCVVDLDPV